MALIDNLISYYKLDENAANTTVADAHGSNTGIAGTNTANLYDASGKINSCFDFSGQWVDIVDDVTLDFGTGDFSVSFWCNPDVDGTTLRALGKDGNNIDVTGFFFQKLNTDVMMFATRKASGPGTFHTGTAPITAAGGWFHIVGARDSGVLRLYVNGATDGTSTESAATNIDNSIGLRIGVMDQVPGTSPFNGQIDEVGLWDRALTPTEVTELYNSGDGFAYPLAPLPPSVLTTGFSLVEETTARVSGNVTDEGTEAITERGIAYALTPNPTITDSTEVVAGTTGAFTGNLTGLSEGTPYFAAAYATNTIGTSYGSDVNFSTKPEAATSFTATEIHNRNIVMTWTKGLGAEKTEIRRKEGSYPTDPADGDQVYFDTGTTVDDTGRTANTEYFYRAWGWDTDSGYSDDFAQLTATTLQEFILTNIINPVGGGTITANPLPSDGVYEAGTSVELTAIVTETSVFQEWSGDLTGTTNPQSVIMSTNRSVTATFLPNSLLFTAGQTAQSLSVAFNDGTITEATLTSTEESGSFDYEMAADGTIFEVVTSGVEHTFSNTGEDLRWRATENAASTGEINNIKIQYE